MNELLQLFQNQYISVIAGGLSGIFTAWLTQRVLNRRGIFSYSVTHNRVGITTEDPIFGSVAVTWNGNTIQNLYLSTIEMKNESLNDYENVIVRAYTSDTMLMTEQTTQLPETPIEWSEKYREQLHVEDGSTPTDNQSNLYRGQREYVIPIFNRGQSIKITYLNSAQSPSMPNIWLSIALKGVKLKFQGPQNQVLGVPQGQAAFVGVLIGLAVLAALVLFASEPWVIATSAMVYGFVAQLPGAYTIRLLRRAREAVGG
ncbi:MAG TPA: hypothetical protein PKY67_08265 [Nitrosomonas sp.]|jgi:hypothetical protein|nr:hypothetical protein [Nitrosomonas sp.]HRB97683.1 hypothetical protein [Nitrosomonas sp.]